MRISKLRSQYNVNWSRNYKVTLDYKSWITLDYMIWFLILKIKLLRNWKGLVRGRNKRGWVSASSTGEAVHSPSQQIRLMEDMWLLYLGVTLH